MSGIRSFSGTHDWHPSVLIDTDVEQGGDADTFIWNIENGICPRCERPLPTMPEYPAGSRITRCRSIPICGRCGSDEVYLLAPASYWPLDFEEIDERRAYFECNTTMGLLTDEHLLDGEGVTPVVNPRGTGGWAQYGGER